MHRPFPLYLLSLLYVFLSVGALYGGWSLMTAPLDFGMDPAWLANSPFESYRAPGLILFLVNGLFPLLILWGLWRRPAAKAWNVLNIYPERHWAWTYSVYSGMVQIAWITVQLTMVPNFWLQPVMLGVGLLILMLTWWPGVMRYYELKKW